MGEGKRNANPTVTKPREGSENCAHPSGATLGYRNTDQHLSQNWQFPSSGLKKTVRKAGRLVEEEHLGRKGPCSYPEGPLPDTLGNHAGCIGCFKEVQQ